MKNYVKLIEKTFSTELEDEQSNVAYLHEFGTVRPKKMFNLPGYVRGRLAPSSFTTIRPLTSREHDRNMTNIKVISYIELKEEREKFRKQIIKVIVSRDTEYNDETIIPSSDEIQLVRYNYYIQHGIDTVHVAPIEQHWISHILDLVPISLKKKHVKEVNAIFLEVKEDFQVAIKKGIVDFVLDDFKFMMQDSISKNDGKQLESFNKSARIEFDQAKQVISKNLFISNPVMVYLHQLWHKQFSDLRLIQVNTFYASKSALDLSDFNKFANESISQAITRLKKDWYPAIHQILSLDTLIFQAMFE
nr:PREDICTED: dynein heavy chain 7, axonemal-like isoform X4 [Bemisia tabaci]